MQVKPAPTPLVVNFARNVKFGMDIKLGVLTHNMRLKNFCQNSFVEFFDFFVQKISSNKSCRAQKVG